MRHSGTNLTKRPCMHYDTTMITDPTDVRANQKSQDSCFWPKTKASKPCTNSWSIIIYCNDQAISHFQSTP